MHSDHEKNSSKRKENKPFNIEVVGEKCSILKNLDGHSTEITSVSSFTHESQKQKYETKNIKERLFQSVNSRPQDIIQGIKNYDKEQTGNILPVNLYNVIRIFCFPLSLKEFNNLIKEEDVDEKGFISYRSFLSNFISNEKVLDNLLLNVENGIDTTALSIEDLEVKIKNKISKNVKNFIRCMWLHDFNNDGLIQKEDLRTVLESICFPLSDDQFNRFWNLYDPNNSGIINYKDFLVKLGTHAESYKRAVPHSKKNASSASNSTKYSRHEQIQILCAKLGRDDPAIQGQFFNRIIEIFKERVKNEFPILMRTLQIKDSTGSGVIHLSVFHQVLNYFVMPMSFQLFKEILRSFNISPNNSKIAWYSFLKKVCVNDDVKYEANSSQIPCSITWKICRSVLEKLKINGKNEDNFFKKAFTLPTQNHKTAVTRAELRRIINQSLVLPINEEEFKSLMFILDPGHTNFIDCEKFLSLFKMLDEVKVNYDAKPPEDEFVERKDQNTDLKEEKLQKTFRKLFNKNIKNIIKAFYAFDSEETGVIKVEDFRKILEVFCFPQTDRQFNEIAGNFQVGNKIFYGDFINFHKKSPFEDEEKWKSSIKRLISPKVIPSHNLNIEDIINYIKNVIISNREHFLQEFKGNDLCNVGTVRKEVFSRLIEKYAFRLTDDQFQELWEKLPKNDIGFLKYQEFLDEWCSSSAYGLPYKSKTPSTNRSNSAISISSKNSSKSSLKERPKTASSVLSNKSAASKINNRPKSAASVSHQSLTNLSIKSNSHLSVQGTVFENCGILTKEQYKQFKTLDLGKAEGLSRPASRSKNNRSSEKTYEKKNQQKESYPNKYECIIKARWRDILRRCKTLDTENHDIVLWDDFLSILQRTGIDVNEETITMLENKYCVKRDLPVNYWIFLKAFLIHLNSDKKFTTGNIENWREKQKVPNNESVGLCKVLINYRDKILKNYRDLHHAFRRADIQHTGELNTLEFRKILTFYKIYMTENDLFYIQDYFDPKLSEKIPYDKFLKSFVKS